MHLNEHLPPLPHNEKCDKQVDEKGNNKRNPVEACYTTLSYYFKDFRWPRWTVMLVDALSLRKHDTAIFWSPISLSFRSPFLRAKIRILFLCHRVIREAPPLPMEQGC